MKISLASFTLALLLSVSVSLGADTSWAGEYSDKKFLNGSAVFQLTIEQSGSKIQVSFDAAKNDGGGCAPEAQGMARSTGKDSLQFSFTDNQGNAGNGTITRKGDEVVLGLKVTRKSKADCFVFYRDNIHLKRAK